MSRPFERILGTLVYALRDGQILMLYRHKEPNLGLWVAPGGKTEPHESPFECALRELREETGLEAQTLVFRGLVTEVSPREHWQWLLHIFVAPDPLGDAVGDEREGRLRWWPIETVPGLPIPQADAIFFPAIIDLSQPFYAARMQYDDELKLIEVVRHTVRT
ncbi:MAG: 8-oxo-dGTP diphosphatase [Ardenticatenaceae bacterium]|nr:8-oxo-dGTP diphosphatase [Ardenticatenaceae bacterium]